MRIAEINTPDLRLHHRESESHTHHPILSEIELLIQQSEAISKDQPLPQSLSTSLRQSLTRLSQLAPFPDNSFKLTIWKLSFRLWNACVDLSNAASLQSSSSSAENIANLRYVAADMLFLAKDVTGVPSPTIKSSLFYYRTGLVWHNLKKFDLASDCFERATEIVSKIDIAKISDAGEKKLFLDLNLARSRTAWEISDRNLAVTLLNRAKNMLFGSSDHYKSLSNQFLAFGKSSLARDDDASSLNDALRLMNEALDLCEKGLGTAKTREDTMEFTGMRIKTLRFISAVHLQKGEYENVIKCVKVLRNGGNGSDGADQHASLPVLAMKAWLGLGRHSEAEKELRGMVGNKDIPEAVWVSAVEAYFEVVGTAGAETAKGVFLGLLGRCHVSAKAALRVAHRVLGESRGGDNGSRIRANVVAQLVSDERVVALFAGEAVTKERKAIHSVIWNSASDHFRAKDYETSAEMFEKSMLYIPHDIENRIFRAKGFRVLCLCYLGLSQLDRALEYIEEAEKLEPNIACSFLKFKIYLQKKDHSCAIGQIDAMTSCLDFSPDYLSPSAHEAISCQALPVAVACLSKFLSFYISGKTMPTTEVVVFRTLVTILTQDIGSETEALDYMLQAQSRASKLGIECFFGSGETGKREQNWFAVTCWNLGSRCGNAKKYELCGEFLRLASEFYGYMDTDESGENTMMICRSITLSVTAMVALEKQNKSTLTETQVKLAAELLVRAGKILSSLLSDGKDCIMEPELIFMYTLNAYDIHGRLNNSAFQLLVVKTFASSKSCNYNYLLQLGIFTSQSPQSNPEVSTFALNECLSALIASASPDYPTVALIIRKLISISSVHKGDTDDEEAILKMYKQAYRIMVGLKEGEYPIEEGKWLAMTAWNRAALPVRLGQFETAKKWLNIGLEIAEKVTGVIEVLVNSGKQIDAVNLAFAFELTEQFPPVALLKSYLTETRRSSSQGRPDNASAVQDEFNERELTGVKAVIKCIEEHNLEDQYPVEPLHKRILQLEKAKAEKKRATEPTKPQPKRPRGAQPRVTDNINNNNNNNNKTGYGRVIPERYPQYVYDNRPFLSGPIMAAQAPPPPPPQTYTFSPAPAHGNFYGNCYQYQAPPPPPYFH